MKNIPNTTKWVKLFRYMITGGFTTALDLLVLYTCVEILKTSVLLGTAIAFIVALLFSFTVNKVWTFSHFSKGNEDVNISLFLKFLFVSCIGFGLSLLGMKIFHYELFIDYKISKLLTSVIVLFWNFSANSLWTFPTKKQEHSFRAILPENNVFPYELSIVIPAYNEEKRIPSTLISALSYFSSLGILYEIIVVDDGSKDNTYNKARNILPDFHKVIKQVPNGGKGKAIQIGVLAAQGRYILFCDADEATPFSEYKHLREEMLWTHIAIGSRYKNRSTVQKKQPLYRIVFSRIINFFTQIFLIEGILDTQCGFKLFRSNVGKQLFRLQRIHRFAFDVEFLLLAKRFGYQISEISVIWIDKEGSTVSGLKDGLRVVRDFLKIKFYMMFGFYEEEKNN